MCCGSALPAPAHIAKISLIISASPQHIVVPGLQGLPNQRILSLAIQAKGSGMELVRDQVEALDLWRRVTVTTVRSDAPDLTARQLAVLMTVRLQPAPHTVRGLAQTLNVGKPAITRALDTLSRLGFVQRRRDPKDGRNVFVERTEKGDAFLEQLGETILHGDAAIQPRPVLQAVS
jgi:DNA-binding MarR family transcriptional regulator